MLNMKRRVIAARRGRTAIVTVSKDRLCDLILAYYAKHGAVLLGRNDLSCSGTIRDDNRTMLAAASRRTVGSPSGYSVGRQKQSESLSSPDSSCFDRRPI